MTVFEVLEAVVACLGESIKAVGAPPTCFLGVVPGDAASFEYVGECTDQCGMAWVRMVSLYPSSSTGVADVSVGNCGKGSGLDLELGVMRCTSVGEGAEPPTPQELAESTALATLDAQAMFRTVACCDIFSEKDYIVGTYTPLGPEGGLVGGIVPVSVSL